MLKIPLVTIKDKQALDERGLRLLGKPVDVVKDLRDQGAKLIHIVDKDALRGMATNMDVYDKLTYLINVEVECAPARDLVLRLLSLRCRVVLRPPVPFDLGVIEEKRLLVARVGKGYTGSLSGFHDVILDDADKPSVQRMAKLGLRVIVVGKPPAGTKPFGSITSSCP